MFPFSLRPRLVHYNGFRFSWIEIWESRLLCLPTLYSP
jgi:hypothetical protein